MNTGSAETRPGYQLSIDGVDWDTPNVVGGSSWYGSIGYSTTTFQSPSLGAYRYVRFGLFIQTTTDGSREMMQASLRVDTRAS